MRRLATTGDEKCGLERKVALKFPSQEMQQDPAARQRFLREARSAAALDHPYVCHIHEVGEDGEQSFISMEYIAGQSLKDRLSKGPLELKDALQKAVEIAEALEAAHKQNIVHRDLKPANIMLTPEGHVKVMDFGLAKRLTSTEEEDSQGNTLSSSLTASGATLGTLPYMSPEQIRGQEVDPRSDIFSFGVVLYEMLTGVHPFKKDTPVETANAILKEIPGAVTKHLDNTPVLLQHTVKKMLAKKPDRRYQLVHEVRTDLEDVITDITHSLEAQAHIHSFPATAPEAAMQSRWRQPIPAVVIALMALATGLLLGFVFWNIGYDGQPTQPKVPRFSVVVPEGATISAAPSVTLSRDGTKLAYTATQDGIRRVYVQTLDQLEANPLPGTEGARVPFFSPEGQWVGFFTEMPLKGGTGELKKVSLSGGAPQTLCKVGIGRGASWGQDGMIVFGKRPGLWRVSDVGGTPERLPSVVGGFFPQILPGVQAVLFSFQGFGTLGRTYSVGVLSLETGEEKDLISPGLHGHYVPTGHLIYAQRGTLLAAPFDLKNLGVTGPSTPVVEGIWMVNGVHYSISETGTLAYVPHDKEQGEKTLVWVDPEGNEEPLTAEPGPYRSPRVSPDGTRLAVTVTDSDNADVWIYDLVRKVSNRLTLDPAKDGFPLWTPDGLRLVFASDRDGGQWNLFWKAADGTGLAQRLTSSPHRQIPMCFSPDGKSLVFSQAEPETYRDLQLMSMEGERRAQVLLKTTAMEGDAQISPDGRWIAYASNELGREEVFVSPFPNVGVGKWYISNGGGRVPLWGSQGRELFYRTLDGALMMVKVETEPTFTKGNPEMVVSPGYHEGSHPTERHYDISPDGQRFLMLKEVEQTEKTRLVVVQNWFEELKRLVPTDN